MVVVGRVIGEVLGVVVGVIGEDLPRSGRAAQRFWGEGGEEVEALGFLERRTSISTSFASNKLGELCCL